ncbi:hypothetical protein PV326_009122 [Microctonus aethiopoides]|nr:hypothetical protein PV326_009122 [Microctonus aethiopoides]
MLLLECPRDAPLNTRDAVICILRDEDGIVSIDAVTGLWNGSGFIPSPGHPSNGWGSVITAKINESTLTWKTVHKTEYRIPIVIEIECTGTINFYVLFGFVM